MKKLLLATLVLLGTVTGAYADEPRTEFKPQDAVVNVIALSEDQARQLIAESNHYRAMLEMLYSQDDRIVAHEIALVEREHDRRINAILDES